MNDTAAERVGATNQPHARLPKPMPLWMRRVAAIDTALELAFLAFALLTFVAGTMMLAIQGIT